MPQKLRSPIRWFGGKGMVAKKIIALFPPHRTYVEPFGGGASVLFAKKPSPVEVYNDIDSGLVNFFRVLRDPAKFERFHQLVALTPYSREEYYFCYEVWESHEDDVERAHLWYTRIRQSFSGDFGGGWSSIIIGSSRGMAGTVSKYLSAIELLPAIATRLQRVQIEHVDWRRILERYDTEDTLFYLDPPYVLETRRGTRYAHELTIADHHELVQQLLALIGKAVLSGYQHSAYEPLEKAGWSRHDYPTVSHAAGHTRATKILGPGSGKRMQSRVESVWVKPWEETRPLRGRTRKMFGF